VIEPLPSRGDEWYQFRHALIRDALYERISPSRRARWHATMALALERLLGDRVDDRAAELARHAVCAGALIEPAVLTRYSCIAGERLLAAHAFEEALGHFERAWRARERLPFDADAAATLVGLGCDQAATAVRWNRQQGWITVRRAIEYYLRAGDISCAIAVATDPRITFEGTTGVAATIQQIREVTPPGSVEEGWLLARLAAAVYFETGDYDAAQLLFRRALGIAAAEHDAGLELRTLAYATSVDHLRVTRAERLQFRAARRLVDLSRRECSHNSRTFVARVFTSSETTRRSDNCRQRHRHHFDSCSLGAWKRIAGAGSRTSLMHASTLLKQLRCRCRSPQSLALARTDGCRCHQLWRRWPSPVPSEASGQRGAWRRLKRRRFSASKFRTRCGGRQCRRTGKTFSATSRCSLMSRAR
jgi:tetratricopeptide (TPR) repeat protein